MQRRPSQRSLSLLNRSTTTLLGSPSIRPRTTRRPDSEDARQAFSRLWAQAHGDYDERLMVKNASVPDDKTTPIYHNFEALTAATNANAVANRAAPKTIVYSCCGPAILSTKRSALGGLSRESQSAILSSIPIVPSRWESWRPISQIYALLFMRGSSQFSVFRPWVR